MEQDGSDVIDTLIKNKKKGRAWTFVWVCFFCIIGFGLVALFTFHNNAASALVADNNGPYPSAFDTSGITGGMQNNPTVKMLMLKIDSLKKDSIMLANKSKEQADTLQSLAKQFTSITQLYDQKIENIRRQKDTMAISASIRALKTKSNTTLYKIIPKPKTSTEVN